MYTWELGKMNMPRSGKTHVQKAPKPSNHTGLISECLPLDGSEVKVTQLCPDSWRPHGLYSPWNSPSQNIGVGCCSFLQRVFPTQGSNPGLPHCRWILYQLSHQGRPKILEWVADPFSSGYSQPRNRTRVSCVAGKFFTD